MRVLKAYADAGATGGQNYPFISERRVERAAHRQPESRQSRSGDSVSLSDEAIRLLQGGEVSPSVCAQDATYDQYGNVTRQFENLQNDLRSLAGVFMLRGDNLAMAGKISALRSQLASLRAQV